MPESTRRAIAPELRQLERSRFPTTQPHSYAGQPNLEPELNGAIVTSKLPKQLLLK